MATIVTRVTKGSPLTITEMDSNFTNLNTTKLEVAATTFGGNAATATTSLAVTGTIASATTATTQTVGDNSTKVATTAYCENFVNNDAGAGGIGTCAYASNINKSQGATAGTTYAGSALYFAYVAGIGDTIGSGTWRALFSVIADGTNPSFTTYQRIS